MRRNDSYENALSFGQLSNTPGFGITKALKPQKQTQIAEQGKRVDFKG